jgi:hypothetical protein
MGEDQGGQEDETSWLAQTGIPLFP